MCVADTNRHSKPRVVKLILTRTVKLSLNPEMKGDGQLVPQFVPSALTLKHMEIPRPFPVPLSNVPFINISSKLIFFFFH